MCIDSLEVREACACEPRVVARLYGQAGSGAAGHGSGGWRPQEMGLRNADRKLLRTRPLALHGFTAAGSTPVPRAVPCMAAGGPGGAPDGHGAMHTRGRWAPRPCIPDRCAFGPRACPVPTPFPCSVFVASTANHHLSTCLELVRQAA